MIDRVGQYDELSLSSVLAREYVRGFVHHGGSAIKVIYGSADQVATVASSLSDEALTAGYIVSAIDSKDARLHLVQHLYHAVSRQVDWLYVADRFARRLLNATKIEYPDSEPLDLERVASRSGLEPQQVNLLIQGQVRDQVFRNPHYTRLFKTVTISLIAAAFDPYGIERARGLRVIEWLRGEPSDRAQLRKAGVMRRLTRQNGRAMLIDTARWIRDAGLPGLFVTLDIARYSDQYAQGTRYSPGATLDLFETIRQFIDGCDDSIGLMMVFLTSPDFLTSSKRGLSAYAALKMRLADDVYDTARPNLLAPLLRAG